MKTCSLAAALEREHHEIDAGIAAFTAAPGDRQPLTRAIGALRRHIYLEEEFLFPLLRDAEPGLAAPVFVMLREHAQLWATLGSLDRAADADTGAWLALCKRLTIQLLHHNLKEEKILYPRADQALPAAAADRLLAFLGSRELPEGWVCMMKARPVARDSGPCWPLARTRSGCSGTPRRDHLGGRADPDGAVTSGGERLGAQAVRPDQQGVTRLGLPLPTAGMA